MLSQIADMTRSPDTHIGNLIDIDQEMPQSPVLIQAKANQAVDSIVDLADICGIPNGLSLGSLEASRDMSRLPSVSPAQELISSSLVMAGSESDTDEEGEAPLSVQPSVSDRRRQQNAKFSSW